MSDGGQPTRISDEGPLKKVAFPNFSSGQGVKHPGPLAHPAVAGASSGQAAAGARLESGGYEASSSTLEELVKLFSDAAARPGVAKGTGGTLDSLLVQIRQRAFTQVGAIAAMMLSNGLPTVEESRVRLAKAVSCFRLRRYSEAREDLNLLLTRARASGAEVPPTVYMTLVQVEAAQGNMLEATDMLLAWRRRLEEEGDQGGGALESGVWRRKINVALVNILVKQSKWRGALRLLHTMELEDVTGRNDVLRSIGKVFLQMGHLPAAEEYFRRAALVEGASLGGAHLDRGMLAFAKGDFSGAQTAFQSALEAAKAEATPPLVLSAVNNLGIAALYTCDITSALVTIEDLLRQDPVLYMTEVTVFNLCTLYDLAFDNVQSEKRKQVLQAVGSRFHLDDIHPSSFRLQP